MASQRKQRLASFPAAATCRLGCVGVKDPGSYAGSSIPTRGRTARSTVRTGSGPLGTRAVAMISASPSWLPDRYSWIEPAARRPAPTAWDDRLGARHDVAAGEDALATRGLACVGHDAGEAAGLDARALGQDRRIGLLAHRHQHRRGGLLSTAAGDRLIDGTAAVEPAGRTLADELDGGDAFGRTDDLRDSRLELDVHALVLRCFDFLGLSRHLGPAAAVEDRD